MLETTHHKKASTEELDALLALYYQGKFHLILEKEEQIISKENEILKKLTSLERKINSLIPFIKNDKKNDDDKINFILLKNIGRTTKPNNFKISFNELKKLSKLIARY